MIQKTNRTFVYNGYEKTKLRLKVCTYRDNSLCIIAYSKENNEEELYGAITVCLGETDLQKNHQYIDVNNLPNIEKFLQNNHIAVATGRKCKSGFVTYPEYKFNEKMLREIDETGYETYLEK